MVKWWDNKDTEREKRRSSGMALLKLRPIVGSDGRPKAEDAKIARIRFLVDADEAESCWVHEILRMGRLGKKFNEDVYCLYMNSGEDCSHCNEGLFPKRKLYFLVYCTEILHIHRDSEKKWPEIEYMEDKFYAEPVNEVRLFVTGVGRSNSTEDKFIRWKKKFKSLCDRNYEWTREGIGLDTVYDLVPDMEKSEETEDVQKARKDLPSLSDMIAKMKELLVKKPDKEEEGTEEPDKSMDAEIDDIFS